MKKEIYSLNSHQLLATAFDSMKEKKTDAFRIHHHAEVELGYICGGEGKYIIGEQVYHAKAGDLFLVKPNEQHCVPTIYTPQLTSFNIYITSYFLWNVCAEYFSPGILKLILGKSQIQHCFAGREAYVKQIRQLCGETCGADVHEGTLRFVLLGLLQSISEELASAVQTADSRQESAGVSAHLSDIQNAIDYINAHLTEQITLRQMADSVNISCSHFSSVFKSVTGLSPYEYLILQRIERAVGILRHTDSSIIDIANECGFLNTSNFNRSFKKITGMSPTEYRMSKR